MQVYITSFPDHSGVWQVSTEGGRSPVWGPAGKELFFLNRGKVYIAEVSEQRGTPKPAAPRLLFDAHVTEDFPSPVDVSRDGKKFVMIHHVESDSAKSLTLISNWTSEIK